MTDITLRNQCEINRLRDEVTRQRAVISKLNGQCDHLGMRLGDVMAERDALAREVLTPDTFMRLVEWLREEPIRPASAAFTAGIERQIAYALEMDVVSEIKRMRARQAHLMAALQEADRIMEHNEAATEWREKWAHLWG